MHNPHHMHENPKNESSGFKSRRKSFLFTWIAAFIGALSFIPAIPRLIPPGKNLPFPMNILILLSILQSIVAAALFAAAGSILAPKIGFKVLLAGISLKDKTYRKLLEGQLVYGILTGLAGAIFAYLLAPDFIRYLNIYPLMTRIFGGLYEEVIIRWGIMTIIIWILWRIFQKGSGSPKNWIAWTGIFLNQILFASGHIPALLNFGIIDPVWPVITIFIISFPWCRLFWKKGLEAAFIAHVSFHAFVIFLVLIKL